MHPDTIERPSESPVVDDPGTVEPKEDSPPGRSWSVFIIGLAMLLLGLGIGAIAFGEDDSPPPAPETSDEAEVPQATVDPAVEPVAAVAEKVLPSVVQLESPAGVGSGVIYDPDGLILTAAHVVAGVDVVEVRLSDGTKYQGRVLGGDASTDVAVVEVDATDLPAADLALDSEVQVGQLAVAIGSPFGLDSTVTSGVVSAVNQTVGRGNHFQSLIQTDAAINPGNSGGALANRDGEVIGINVSIYSPSGGNIGVGFAVPITVAYDLAEAVVAGEPIERAVLGITGTTTESGPAGALVIGVVPGSGADTGGVEVGDVIMAVDGTRVETIGDLIARIGTYRPGSVVTLDVIRAGEELQLEVELGSQ